MLQTWLRSAHERFLKVVVGATHDDLRRRPMPEVWSALEYMAHTRDVVSFYAERISRTLREDQPSLSSPNWEAETDSRQYNLELPADVLEGIRTSSEALADLLLTVSDQAWHRQALGSTGERRDVLMFAKGAVHETVHHCKDARTSLGSDSSV
ncbi:MAG: DinB family protein [Actinobacteria bacterium]|nr:DinB family protein [Actinomycetota bacterium]